MHSLPRPMKPKLTFVQRYGEFVVVLFVLGLATFLLVGTLTMDVPDGTGSPGPKFFPSIVSGLLYFLAVLLAVTLIRKPSTAQTTTAGGELSQDMLEDFGAIDSTTELRVLVDDDYRDRPTENSDPTQESPASSQARPQPEQPNVRTDWITTIKILLALIGFILLLQPLGWILSAAALFWVVAWALGSKRPVFDVGVSLIFSSGVQLAFVAGLGLNLPAGVFGGLF